MDLPALAQDDDADPDKATAEREALKEYPGGVPVSPVHPGISLGAELHARGLSANAFALKLRVPANRISEILRGRRAITAETALRIGRALGTGAAFWVNLQAQYDLATAERDHGTAIEREVEAG